MSFVDFIIPFYIELYETYTSKGMSVLKSFVIKG